jgi:tetratricopeptide (TPR) repeat protein
MTELGLYMRTQRTGLTGVELAYDLEELSTTYNTVGVILMAQGQAQGQKRNAQTQAELYDKAQELLRKAEMLTEQKDLMINRPPRIKLRAVTLNNLGCLYRRRGKLHSALKFLEKALKLEHDLERAVGELDDPASTHLNLCATLSEMGRHELAADHAASALRRTLDKMGLPLDVDPNEIPDTQAELGNLLAIAFYNLGVAQDELKAPEDGLANIAKGALVAQRFFRDTPKHRDMEKRKAELEKKVAVIRQDREARQANADANEAPQPQPPAGSTGGFGSTARRSKKR